jgi:hypothetical protein
LKGGKAMAFVTRTLVFAIDIENDGNRDRGKFIMHDGQEVLEKKFATCGYTNPRGNPNEPKDAELAVAIKTKKHLKVLKAALSAMLGKLEAVEKEFVAQKAERKALAALEKTGKKKSGKVAKKGR